MDISFGYKQISLDITWISLMDMNWISLGISDGYLHGYILGYQMDIIGYILDNF